MALIRSITEADFTGDPSVSTAATTGNTGLAAVSNATHEYLSCVVNGTRLTKALKFSTSSTGSFRISPTSEVFASSERYAVSFWMFWDPPSSAAADNPSPVQFFNLNWTSTRVICYLRTRNVAKFGSRGNRQYPYFYLDQVTPASSSEVHIREQSAVPARKPFRFTFIVDRAAGQYEIYINDALVGQVTGIDNSSATGTTTWTVTLPTGGTSANFGTFYLLPSIQAWGGNDLDISTISTYTDESIPTSRTYLSTIASLGIGRSLVLESANSFTRTSLPSSGTGYRMHMLTWGSANQNYESSHTLASDVKGTFGSETDITNRSFSFYLPQGAFTAYTKNLAGTSNLLEVTFNTDNTVDANGVQLVSTDGVPFTFSNSKRYFVNISYGEQVGVTLIEAGDFFSTRVAWSGWVSNLSLPASSCGKFGIDTTTLAEDCTGFEIGPEFVGAVGFFGPDSYACTDMNAVSPELTTTNNVSEEMLGHGQGVNCCVNGYTPGDKFSIGPNIAPAVAAGRSGMKFTTAWTHLIQYLTCVKGVVYCMPDLPSVNDANGYEDETTVNTYLNSFANMVRNNDCILWFAPTTVPPSLSSDRRALCLTFQNLAKTLWNNNKRFKNFWFSDTSRIDDGRSWTGTDGLHAIINGYDMRSLLQFGSTTSVVVING